MFSHTIRIQKLEAQFRVNNPVKLFLKILSSLLLFLAILIRSTISNKKMCFKL